MAERRRQPRGPRFDDQRPLVELLVVQISGRVQEVVQDLLDLLDLVGRLLELADLPDDVRNLIGT